MQYKCRFFNDEWNEIRAPLLCLFTVSILLLILLAAISWYASPKSCDTLYFVFLGSVKFWWLCVCNNHVETNIQFNNIVVVTVYVHKKHKSGSFRERISDNQNSLYHRDITILIISLRGVTTWYTDKLLGVCAKTSTGSTLIMEIIISTGITF